MCIIPLENSTYMCYNIITAGTQDKNRTRRCLTVERNKENVNRAKSTYCTSHASDWKSKGGDNVKIKVEIIADGKPLTAEQIAFIKAIIKALTALLT